MKHHSIWLDFGEAILAEPTATLRVFLGDETAGERLRDSGVAGPTLDDFRVDEAFDPNPYGLDVPADECELSLFGRALAVWGPDVLVRAALACADLQIETTPDCPEHLVLLRDNAHIRTRQWLECPSARTREQVKRASEDCFVAYAPFEDDPDTEEAQTTWSALGAAWFAAATASDDHELQSYDGPGPREASPSWCTRNATWPLNAAASAAVWTSPDEVLDFLRTALLGAHEDEPDS